MNGKAKLKIKTQEMHARPASPEFTLRVGNLSEKTTRNDVFDLFRGFGRITRIFVNFDDRTKKCRGTALVSFAFEEDAEEAQVRMDRYKMGYLVLSVERLNKSQNSNGKTGGTESRATN